MPRLTVWAVRASLLHLLAGFTVGALLLAQKGIDLSPFLWRGLPAHAEFLLFGWTLQLGMGVAYWILPRRRGRRQGEALAVASFALLNAGVLLAASTPLLTSVSGLRLGGKLLQFVAVSLFAFHAWPRVRQAGA